MCQIVEIVYIASQILTAVVSKPRTLSQSLHASRRDTAATAGIYTGFSRRENMGQSEAVSDPDRFRWEFFIGVSYRVEERQL